MGDYYRYLIFSNRLFKLRTYLIIDSLITTKITSTASEQMNDAITYSTVICTYWNTEKNTSFPLNIIQ